jgi:hypothetical protein
MIKLTDKIKNLNVCLPLMLLPNDLRLDPIKKDLLGGALRTPLAKKYHVYFHEIKRIADSLGLKDNRGAKPSDKCGKMTKKEVLDLHKQGVKHPFIAKRAGVSRERIRQIVEKAGLVPRRFTQQAELKIRKAQKAKDLADRRKERERLKPIHAAAAIKKRCEYMGKANEMWAKGDWMKVIAKDYKIPMSSLSWYIGFCRKHGAECGSPGMFPQRGNGHHGTGRRG